MGIQEVKKLLHNQHRRHDTRVQVVEEEDRGQKGAKVWVLGLSRIDGIAMPPLQQLKPVKTGRRRHDDDSGEEERTGDGEEEEPVTPRGEGWRIPAEATTCPPAPKKPRTAVSIIRSGAAAGRRCNCDDGEVVDEFFRVPADLEAVFVSRAAKAN